MRQGPQPCRQPRTQALIGCNRLALVIRAQPRRSLNHQPPAGFRDILHHGVGSTERLAKTVPAAGFPQGSQQTGLIPPSVPQRRQDVMQRRRLAGPHLGQTVDPPLQPHLGQQGFSGLKGRAGYFEVQGVERYQ